MAMIDVGGVRLHATLIPQRSRRPAGQAPMVFVHGLAASQAFWYAAGVQVLTGLGPCLVYDLRGHGKSDTPETGFGLDRMSADLLAVMDAHEIPRANIVCHSFGGMIALYTALKAPERVQSLVLADVRVRPLQQKLDIAVPAKALPPGLIRRLRSLGIDAGQISNADDGVDYLRTVARIQLAAGDEAGDLLSAIYHHPGLFRSRRNAQKWVQLAERAAFVDALREGDSFGAQDLGRLSLPMLILVGAKSSTLASARALHELCPTTVLREIPDMGHFFPMSRPRLFLRPTVRFLHAVNTGRLKGV
ncbi:pimeloyl-ACP methyl ester carboxylesterase [Rhodovulum bhavnagarense]|uniref:Pimeloyl-ACP methyl ester carboxylesterase n=1 Tax=Rhodovulum bhavnagarense TaxID=992286 RepID=A0A4R2RI41_9RHOB|nr:alpha/beta hydrolase [Rhodovulum bhavnagarense]TCP63430.1 pimeloyl-ACP methyl ester carboxylesterase [Rhodovulum bhavnagarense]